MTKFLLQEMGYQGVYWLKARRSELLSLCAMELIKTIRPYEPQISDNSFFKIAGYSIDCIIAQVENPIIASHNMQNNCLNVLENREVSSQYVITAVELMQSILVGRIKLELSTQTSLRKYLIEKINYTVHLFKASLAEVIVSQQAAQYI